MKVRWRNMLATAFSALPLLPLMGCFCGQFFRGANDVVGISIGPTGTSVQPGGTQQFTATGTFGAPTTTAAGTSTTGDVTALTKWSSSNPSIASISPAGLATGIKVGTVTISGTCQCYTSTTNLAVGSQASSLTSIAVTPSNATVGVGNTQQFVATATYSDGTTAAITSTAAWTSGNTSIATINASGLATGVAAGTTRITATSGSVTGNTILTVQ
jgi:uncharacterized protein YjdB